MSQVTIPVPALPPVDLDGLRLALTFWGVRKSPKDLARHVDAGRWELEVLDPGPPPVGLPPLRAAGRTRDECLRAALAAAREALVAHAEGLRRREEALADQRRDVLAFLGREG